MPCSWPDISNEASRYFCVTLNAFVVQTCALIKSSHKSQSAQQLWASSSSWGPDFVSLDESVFCEMSTKKAWPLCTEAMLENCFDTASQVIVRGKLRKREMKHSRVDVWH